MESASAEFEKIVKKQKLIDEQAIGALDSLIDKFTLLSQTPAGTRGIVPSHLPCLMRQNRQARGSHVFRGLQVRQGGLLRRHRTVQEQLLCHRQVPEIGRQGKWVAVVPYFAHAASSRNSSSIPRARTTRYRLSLSSSTSLSSITSFGRVVSVWARSLPAMPGFSCPAT